MIDDVIASGEGLEKFRENIAVQGGDAAVCDDPEKLICKDLFSLPVVAVRDGFIDGIDAQTIGTCISQIGGGRTKAEDSIDHAVGYSCAARIGDDVRIGNALGIIHCRRKEDFDRISAKIQAAYSFSEERPPELKLVRAVIS
jgi:thymidine phosphorylase